MYSSFAVANYFLDLAEYDGEGLTPMKLQKLVYLAHGWHLAVNDEPLLNEEVEAWTWGPVISNLYHEFKSFGRSAITDSARTSRNMRLQVPHVNEQDKDTRALLDKVWNVYSQYTGFQLANMVHEQGTPWYKTRRSRESIIKDALMKEHFRKLAR